MEKEGTNYILTLALGTPEHGGRVRAAGKNHTPTSYFHIPRRSSKRHTQQLEAKLRDKEDENMVLKRKVREYESIMMEKGIPTSPSLEKVVSNSVKSNNHTQPSYIDDHVSHVVGDKRNFPSRESSLNANNYVQREQSIGRGTTNNPTLTKPKSSFMQAKDNCSRSNVAVSKPKSNSGQPQECRLALGDRGNIVAKATVHGRQNADETLHSVPLGKTNVRVSIHSIIGENRKTPLPRPINEDILTIGSAIGTFVAWPEKLVTSGDEGPMICSENVENDLRDKMSAESQLLVFAEMVDDIMCDPLHVEKMFPMDKGVFEREIDFMLL